MEQESKAYESKDLKLTTSYPVIRGPSDATFEFSVEVDSHTSRYSRTRSGNTLGFAVPGCEAGTALQYLILYQGR